MQGVRDVDILDIRGIAGLLADSTVEEEDVGFSLALGRLLPRVCCMNGDKKLAVSF